MYNFSDFNQSTEKTIEWFRREISTLRTGRASPQLVEGIKVDYYGEYSLLSHIASISVQDAKTIIIQPWDKGALPAIEKALVSSSLGVQPIVDGDAIRLVMPEMTMERRQTLVDLVNEKSEEAKVSVRRQRSEVWNDIQKKEQKKEISEDEKFRLKDELQKIVDESVKELENNSQQKIKEIQA